MVKLSTPFHSLIICFAFLAVWFGYPQPKLDFQNDILHMAQAYTGVDTDTPLSGLKIVITGATSGIGLGLTTTFAKLGATIIVLGRNPTKLQYLVDTLEGHIIPILVSLADLSSVKQAASKIVTQFPKIDILINNAGIHYGIMPCHKPHTPQGHDYSFGVNYLSHFVLTEHMIPLLEKSEHTPIIIQISSSFHWGSDGAQLQPSLLSGSPQAATWQSYWPWGSQQAYNDSKLAQILHARALQQRYPHIVIKSICPGWVGTKIGGAIAGIFLKQLAFPSNGYGLASTLQAIFTKDTSDWLTNSQAFEVSSILPAFFYTKWAANYMVRDGIMVVTAGLILWLQKFGGKVQPRSKSSPESYDIKLQDFLYTWSKQEVVDFL